MKRPLKATVVVCFVALGVLGFVSMSFATEYAVKYQRASRSGSTKDVYLQNCARCHGIDGRGQTEQGRKYDVPDLVKEAKDASSAKITKIITNGRQDMPAFGKKLTKQQVTALMNYVKKL